MAISCFVAIAFGRGIQRAMPRSAYNCERRRTMAMAACSLPPELQSRSQREGSHFICCFCGYTSQVIILFQPHDFFATSENREILQSISLLQGRIELLYGPYDSPPFHIGHRVRCVPRGPGTGAPAVYVIVESCHTRHTWHPFAIICQLIR